MAIPILFTIPNFITAGSGRAMLNIVERLDRNRFSPAICVSQRGGKLDQEVGRLGILLIEADFTVPPKPYATLLFRIQNAAKVFRPYRFKLWHSFHYSDDYTETLIARASGAKAWMYTKKNMGWGSRAWKLRSLFASAIAAQNSDMLTVFFPHSLYKRKAVLLPPGVDTKVFHPHVIPVLNVRSGLGMDKAEIIITCVAELVPVKGHSYLLQAMAEIPNAHLFLAGRPSDEAYTHELHRQAEALGISDRVHFLGKVDDIPALLAESDIFVLPTINKGEGCPVALLEAMACGKACVATDVPGSRDVIQDQENGLFASPQDHASLSGKLQRLIHNPALRIQLGQAAHRSIVDHHTIDHEVGKYQTLYRKMLKI
ncbi:MAG: glycosyltransferase family 4 protein [Anaerolineales bacterium]|nr:glycosyltransferase family 4 protein [Anaerolineales bacterium]